MKIFQNPTCNHNYKHTEYRCEKSGIKLQKIEKVHEPFTVEYTVQENSKSRILSISKEVFDIMFNLIC